MGGGGGGVGLGLISVVEVGGYCLDAVGGSSEGLETGKSRRGYRGSFKSWRRERAREGW